MDLLENLGFIINKEKSILCPSKTMEFLGFTVDATKCFLLLPLKKITKIRKEIRQVLKRENLTLGELARLLGPLSSSIKAIFPGPLNYRALQRVKVRALRSGLWYEDHITLDQEARSELSWWLENLDAWTGKAIFGSVPEFVLESDASLHGWGACLLDHNTGGIWSQEDSSHHKLFRTDSWSLRLNELQTLAPRQVSHPEDGQNVCSSLHKSSGRYKITRSFKFSQKTLDVLPRTQDRSESRISTGEIEHFCGLELEVPFGSQRLETQCFRIPVSQQNLGSPRNRPFCEQTNFPVGELLQLDARPRCSRCEFLSPVMERNKSLRLPSICHDPESSSERETGPMLPCPDNPLLAISSLAPHHSRTSLQPSLLNSFPRESSYRRRWRKSPPNPDREFEPSSLESVRRSNEVSGLSSTAATLLGESWAPGTQIQQYMVKVGTLVRGKELGFLGSTYC